MAAAALRDRVPSRITTVAPEIDTIDEIDFDDVPELLDTLKDHDLVKNAMRILAEGNLQDYSKQAKEQMKSLEADSMHEYMDVGRTQSVLDLHKEVQSTDGQLATMSDMLQGFQSEMSTLSDQIQTLLDASVSMKVKLENREQVEVALHNITHHVTIDEELINGVCNGEVSENYVKYLVKLDKVSSWIRSTKTISSDEVRAISEVEPLVSMLQSKAVERIREFLLTKVSSLQRPNTNIPIMQQTFLRYKKFFEALMEYNVDVGVEIKNRYVEIVSNIFSAQFKTYLNGLLKCKPDDATRYDLLGLADASRSRSAGLFALGDRFSLVSEIVAHISSAEHDAPTKSVSSLSQSMALPTASSSSSHASNSSPRKPGHSRSNSQSGAIATEEKPSAAPAAPPVIGPNPIILAAASDHKKFNFEWIFHSMQLVLLDTVSSEILFQREFFSFDLFQQVFANVTIAAEEMLDSYLNNTYDCVAILLMIILVERDLRVMSHRGVPSLDPYLARCTNKLLTRLLHLIDSNVQSLKGAKPQDMITVFDVRPHVVTRRYAELVVAVNVLCAKMENHISCSRILAKMKLLCAQTKDLLLRISSLEMDEIKRSVFLINNYDLILVVLKERSIDMAPEAADFGEMFDVEVISCVELELAMYFGKMITFVKKKTQQPDLKVSADVINEFVKDFAKNWKDVLKKISGDMMTLFSNFTTGGRVLQKTFAQLVLYYKRFEDLVKNHYKELFARISADFVAISAMTYEMKQYTSALNF